MLIMSFNVKRFIMFKFGRYKRVINYIKDKKPDIIGFQELTDKSLRLYKKNLNDYNIVGTVGSSKNILLREYCSIFLDKRFKIISEKTYALTHNPNIIGVKEKEDNLPRICVVCHFIDDNNRYMIINTHIDNTDGKNKKKQLDIFQSIIDDELDKDELLIITGDFNMSLNNKNIPKYIKEHKYLDPFFDYMGGSFPSKPDMRMIDHIYLKGFDCGKFVVDTTSNDCGFLSDHNPISCEVIPNKDKKL